MSESVSEKKRVVVAGGGTSGWLAATAIAKLLPKHVDVTLIESEEIGRVGVGEATIPPLRTFHRLLGIDEAEFMRATQATFKLGIEFQNWGQLNDSYIHSFGVTGKDCWACDFQHFWLGAKARNLAGEFGDYCLELQAAKKEKMLRSDKGGLNYAYHLDAGRYAQFLRNTAESYGVQRVEGVIERVELDQVTGEIKTLHFDHRAPVGGDLFIDCTGFSARLIHGALGVGFERWDHYLPCDSAVAIQSENVGAPKPYTQSIAHPGGWQWRIPLQHRSGNGLVYCSQYLAEDEAENLLRRSLQGQGITDSKAFRFVTGRRKQTWHKNCVAIGLASGFLEPLESTSIHLAMSGILRLLKFFPRMEIEQSLIDEYNTQTHDEVAQIRDFLILHYHATQRKDTPFWQGCAEMAIPDSLSHRLDLFRETAQFPLREKELFKIDSWTQVLLGQRILPKQYHPIVDSMKDSELSRFLAGMKNMIDQQVENMPSHEAFIQRYCGANSESKESLNV